MEKFVDTGLACLYHNSRLPIMQLWVAYTIRLGLPCWNWKEKDLLSEEEADAYPAIHGEGIAGDMPVCCLQSAGRYEDIGCK